jgi:dihydrolipoamide dehydrogenase
LDLKKVPEHLILIGGGVIGLEMGSVWSRLGAKVTVVEFLPDIAAGADKEIAYADMSDSYLTLHSKAFQKVLASQGLTFVMESAVQGATKDGNNWKVEVKDNKTGAISHVRLFSFCSHLTFRLLEMLSSFLLEEDPTQKDWVWRTLD